MSIPSNITKEDLLEAIRKIDEEGIPENGDSQYYDVFYNGKTYPPKLIVSYANIAANGEVLNRNSFKGGLKSKCFKLLKENGFEIMEKDELKVKVSDSFDVSFYDSIIEFIKQAQTTNQKHKHYPKVFQDLKVKVSFGSGNKAGIPWIAFLRSNQAVSNGIYPVLLYYIEHNILILAYGLSETQKSNNSWNLDLHFQSIEELFKDKFNTKPARYGESFVHSYYLIDTNAFNFGINSININQDLAAVIEKYKGLPLDQPDEQNVDSFTSKNKVGTKVRIFDYREFITCSKESGLNFSDKIVLRFISSLCTKPFVILTGLAGSGKTKLAQAFANWISTDENLVCIVPVGADWTNREPLLGFANALDPTKYSIPENGALELLIRAHDNPDKPHFLILDEMNLSHVERYFADFLSAMESKEAIPLHSSDEELDGVPKSINLPSNLFIIGTVNIDETTYMFSPKVLDRANAIEFRVTYDEMESYLNSSSKLDLSILKARGADMAADFVRKAKAEENGFADCEILNSALLSFFRELKKVGAEFGYRTASEIKKFAEVVHTLDPKWSTNEIVDAAIMQKLLPKLHGSKRKIESSLKALANLCLVQQEDVIKVLNNIEEANLNDTARVKYPISLEKISRMYKAAVQDGFTSFAEA